MLRCARQGMKIYDNRYKQMEISKCWNIGQAAKSEQIFQRCLQF